MNNAFEYYVLGGGWAMFILVPALVVGVASVVRVLFAGAGADDSTRDGMVRPLVWIYAVAPLVGAAGTASRALYGAGADTANTILLPLGWGIGIGLGALVGYIVTGPRHRADKISRWLFLAAGLVALVVAAVLVSVSNHRGSARTKENQPTLSVSSLHQGDGEVTPAPVLELADGRYTIDGQPVEATDIMFRLAGIAARSESIIIKIQKDQPASHLQEALALVNQAGFVHVGIDSKP